jgi:predicted RecA/RadA family phage recombinase
MAKGTYVQKGERIDYTNSTASAIGYKDILPLVTRISIALEDIAVGATGTIGVTGILELSAENTVAFDVGDQLYWDQTNGKLTKTSTSNILAGWCTEPKTTTGTTARVKIG